MDTVVTEPRTEKNLEIAGLLAFFALIGTGLFIDNILCRLPLLCSMTMIVLIFGVADLFGKGVRLRWRLVNAVMIGFVLWHLPAKILFAILVLSLVLRMIFNRSTPLC